MGFVATCRACSWTSDEHLTIRAARDAARDHIAAQDDDAQHIFRVVDPDVVDLEGQT